MNLKVASLVFVHTPGVFGAAIRLFTRRIGEGPSKCNHVAGVVWPGDINSAEIVEAINSGIVRRPFAELLGRGRTIEVWEPINLSDVERADIAASVVRKVGDKYGWCRVATAAADWFLFEKVFFRKLCSQEEDCSTLWGAGYRSVGRNFGKDSGVLTPDDMHDFVTQHPQFYRHVMTQKGRA